LAREAKKNLVECLMRLETSKRKMELGEEDDDLGVRVQADEAKATVKEKKKDEKFLVKTGFQLGKSCKKYSKKNTHFLQGGQEKNVTS
jgi:hypothetical protein